MGKHPDVVLDKTFALYILATCAFHACAGFEAEGFHAQFSDFVSTELYFCAISTITNVSADPSFAGKQTLLAGKI